MIQKLQTDARTLRVQAALDHIQRAQRELTQAYAMVSLDDDFKAQRLVLTDMDTFCREVTDEFVWRANELGISVERPGGGHV